MVNRKFIPKFSSIVFTTSLGLFFFVGSVGFTYALIIIENIDNMIILIFVIGIFGGTFYGYYYLSFIWKMRLVITDEGIFYEEPLETIYCRWENIKSIAWTNKSFVLLPGEVYKQRRNKLKTILITRDNHPNIQIHPFINRWRKTSDWRNEDLLILLSKYLPGIESQIIEVGEA